MQADLDGRGWLPTDLARESGLSKMTVSRVLSGKRQNARTWERLAQALGFTAARYRITRVVDEPDHGASIAQGSR